MARKVLAVALLALIGVSTYQYVTGDSDGSPRDTSQQEEHSSLGPAAGKSAGPLEENRLSSAGTLPTRTQPRREPDLYDEVTTLLVMSEAGDAKASRLVAAAYSECWQYAVNPAGFEEDIKLKASLREDLAVSLTSARDRVVARCRRFAGQQIGSKAIRAMVKRAADQGDLASEAQLFAERAIRTGRVGGEEISPMVHRVLASRDAEAYAAIAPLMGRISAGSQTSMAPIPVGSDLAEAAWNVAACRLGRACGSDSRAVLQMCLGGGVNCEFRDLENFYTQAVMPPADHASLRQLTHQLIQGPKQ